MYKISVPVMSKNFYRCDRKKIADKLKAIGAERIFVALDVYKEDEVERKKDFEMLKSNIDFLKKEGFETGVWLWTFWSSNEKYVHIRTSEDEKIDSFVCPSDENFREFAAGYIRDVAKCDPDMIMYDDDYRLGHLGTGQGCLCENHLEYMSGLLGEKLKFEGIKEKLFEGEGNKYRSAWLAANKHYMLKFAEDMRTALNEINPDIRFGLCACMSPWDFDGASAVEISKTLAGNTKPFLRLIGAPYWAVNRQWGNRLQDIIEIVRMQLAWCEGENAEVFVEGDVYPRPRLNCPSSFLEIFDTALRADARADGILKYVCDYTSSADYENGYIERHMRSKSIYSEIDKYFSEKEAVGVRVYESLKKFENMKIPKIPQNESVTNMFFSPAARMLANNAIPTVYDGKGLCGIAFGENIKYVPEDALGEGMIIDLRAAEILTEKGIDVGLRGKEGNVLLIEEYFIEENEYVPVSESLAGFNAGTYKLILDEKAVIQSINHGEEEAPLSYIYENKKGQRFFVLAFDGYYMPECMYRQYTRSRQLKKNIEWLSGRNLPAYSQNNPDLYIMTKKEEGLMAVGLWNCFADSIFEPEIILDKEYEDIKFINCRGKICGNKVYLSELKAYEFAGFEVV